MSVRQSYLMSIIKNTLHFTKKSISTKVSVFQIAINK